MGIGSSHDAEVVSYMIGWLRGEVERLLVKFKPANMDRGGDSKAWCNTFRIGCADRIAERIEQEVTAARKSLGCKDLGECREDGEPVQDNSRYALAIIDLENEFKKTVQDMVEGMKLGKAAARKPSRGQGYSAGRAAGNQAILNGKGLTG